MESLKQVQCQQKQFNNNNKNYNNNNYSDPLFDRKVDLAIAGLRPYQAGRLRNENIVSS
jgi:hypothetical protein